MLAVQLVGAIAADTIKLAVRSPMSGPFALQGEERLRIFQASADIVGWKTEAYIDPKDTIPPVKCQVERPPNQEIPKSGK